MKTLLTSLTSLAVGFIAATWLWGSTWPTERCAKIMAEERAGWIASMSTLNQVMQAQNDQLYRAKRDLEARAIQQQAEHIKLQHDYARKVAESIMIPEPVPLQVKSIQALAGDVSVTPTLWPQIKALKAEAVKEVFSKMITRGK